MSNSILCRKLIVLTVAIVLLVCGVQEVCYSQDPPPKVMSAGEMRERVLPVVVLIKSNSGSGSGVVVETGDGEKVVLTNEHITRGDDVVTVYFIASDSEGRYIRDRGFYLELSNKSVLRRLGYITNGRVIAEDSEADVAIIRPSGFPRTAGWFIFDKEHLDTKYVDVYNNMNKGEQVHFFGHPVDQGLLWQWNAGHFQGYDERNLFYEGRPWKGNSGGPVVNKDGALIGITKSIDDVTRAWAVSLEPIIALVSDLKEWYIFSIFNETESPVVYEISWSESNTWEQNSLEPGKWDPHPQPTDTPGVITPKIRYISTQQQDPQVPVNTDTEHTEPQSGDALVNITYTEHEIKNIKRQFFGSDIQERIDPKLDGYNYRFIDAESKKIELQEPRQTIWIANHTTETQRYKIKWSASRLDEKNYTTCTR